MLKQFKYKDIVWLDLESPTSDEVGTVGRQYKIHPLVLAELAGPSERSKVDVYSEFIYLVLHFPTSEGGQEIDFILGRDFIITTHYELMNPLNDFAKIFETDFMLKKSAEKIHAGFIFFYIIKEIYSALETNLSVINKQLKSIEQKVFSGHEREVVAMLSSLNRQLLEYQWTMKSHKEILDSLTLAGEDLFGVKFHYYLQATCGEDRKMWKMIENSRQTFNDLRNTNESLLSIKTNETMRVLTVIAAIFLPLNIVAQMYGASNLSFVLMGAFFVAGIWLAKTKQWL